jgi:hypothetical protein
VKEQNQNLDGLHLNVFPKGLALFSCLCHFSVFRNAIPQPNFKSGWPIIRSLHYYYDGAIFLCIFDCFLPLVPCRAELLEQCSKDRGGGFCPTGNTCCLRYDGMSGCIPNDLGSTISLAARIIRTKPPLSAH